MVILPDTDASGAVHIAEEIRVAIETTSFEQQGQAYPVTVSIGVSSSRPIYGTAYSTLVSEADRALYQSKKRGRNCVTTF